MKLKLKSIIYILLLNFFLGCQNNKNFEGHYSVCNKGTYIEVYFKKDSMRVATESAWVKLSTWRKIKLQNDTLHFETFGEWRDSSKAILKYDGMNKVKFRNIKTGDILNLESFNDNLNFEKTEEFWKGFNNRKKSNNCQ